MHLLMEYECVQKQHTLYSSVASLGMKCKNHTEFVVVVVVLSIVKE
jgi:hypothetical protein